MQAIGDIYYTHRKQKGERGGAYMSLPQYMMLAPGFG